MKDARKQRTPLKENAIDNGTKHECDRSHAARAIVYMFFERPCSATGPAFDSGTRGHKRVGGGPSKSVKKRSNKVGTAPSVYAHTGYHAPRVLCKLWNCWCLCGCS